MSEFTDWYPVSNPTQSGGATTTWSGLDNIIVDDPTDAVADAVSGTWANDSTKVVIANGNPAIDPLIPDDATFDSVELRMYFELPQAMFFTVVNILRSSSSANPVFAQTLGVFGAGPELKTVNYALVVDDAEGRAIAEGGSIAFIYSAYNGSGEAGQWQLDWRFAEMRIEYTRAPFTPKSQYIAMF